ncbi:hypothetical protein Bbad01_20940 [Bacillus badius]|nr:hypothetical protein Bbad01_20940 [Bacillus badius]
MVVKLISENLDKIYYNSYQQNCMLSLVKKLKIYLRSLFCLNEEMRFTLERV